MSKNKSGFFVFSFLFLVVISALAISSSIYGETRQTKTGTYLTEPFDPNVDTLKSGFLGHNAKEIHAKLSKLAESLKKDEFETTGEYNRRRANIVSVPYLGSITKESFLAFVIKGVNLKTQYDADAQLMNLNLTVTDYFEGYSKNSSEAGRDKSRVNITWSSDLDPSSNTSSSAISDAGVRFSAININSKSVNISVANPNQFGVSNTSPRLMNVAAKMDVSTARRTKDKLALVLVGRAANPLVSKGTAVVTATPARPIGGTNELSNVIIELSAVWVIDSETGEVFTKQLSR